MTDPISLTRIFCGALFFPTVATFLGASLYKSVPSQFKRTILGGLTFVVVKGLLKIYHKQHQYIRQCQKQIIDIPENNKPTFLINFHERLFISSATFGSLVLDRKNMLFVYFPEWMNETTLMKSRKLSVIFFK